MEPMNGNASLSDLTELLDGFNVNVTEKQPRDFIKQRGRSDQQKRREILLQQQKIARRDLTDHARRLAGERAKPQPPPASNSDSDPTESDTNDNFNAMEIVKMSGKEKAEANDVELYRDELMPPEHLSEIPMDFPTHWACIPIPIGTRCLMIASGGKTAIRRRNGSLMMDFQSPLFGGSVKSPSRKKYCILDCVYVEAIRAFFIVDLMAWNGHSYYDCDAEFRFFWLQTKWGEDGPFDKPIGSLGYRLLLAPRFQCSLDGIKSAVACDIACPVEGIYFYHKEGHYMRTVSTPLMCRIDMETAPALLSAYEQLSGNS